MTDEVDRLNAALAGRYRIERRLGRGGTATVYLAEDLRHKRKVAVKVLYPQLAATLGPERFLREVQIAASLTHPHILGLHDSGEADGFLFYVMPFIEGESLRARLVRDRVLPIADAVEILRDVVDALAYAHRRGLVHRDIKPDNVLLAEGHGMVTDFGVAKAVSEAAGMHALTTAGLALGTPSYMAPEQAAAEPDIDHRADVYAVGAMAYELLTGDPPFTGDKVQSVLAAHISRAPVPVAGRREEVPPRLARFVMQCLEKEPAARWQTADEMLAELESIRAATVSGVAIAAKPKSSPVRLAVITGVVVAIAVVGFLGWASLRAGPPAMTVSNIRQLTRAPEVEIEPAISPDGREVAYIAGFGVAMDVFVRDLAGGRPLALTADRPGGQFAPRWTADGRSIVFAEQHPDGRELSHLIPRLGGPASPIANAPVAIHGDRMAYVIGSRIVTRPLEGGPETVVVTHDPTPHSVSWSPDGKRLAYVVGNWQFRRLETLGNVGPSAIWTAAAAGGDSVQVTESQSLNVSPVWLPDSRHLLFVSNRDGPRDLYVVRLNSDGRARGKAVRVTTGLNPHSVSVSSDGSFAAFSQFTYRRNIWALDLPRAGTVSIRQARPVTQGNQTAENHGVSRDGQWLAFDSNIEGNQDIFIVPSSGGEPRRLTTDPADDFHPDFSQATSEIVFYSTRHGTRDVFVMAADGSNERRITDSSSEEYHPSFSPDALKIAYTVATGGTAVLLSQIWIVERPSLEAPWGEPRMLTEPGFYSRWSPASDRIVYATSSALAVATLDGTTSQLLEWEALGLAPFDVAGWAEWGADGRWIWFLARDGAGQNTLWRVSAGGGFPQKVVLFDDPTKPPAFGFSLHGNTAYFSLTEHDSDVYLMDLEIR